MKYHYVYRIDRPSTGEYYVGIRSCTCRPEEDDVYWGSGVRVKCIPTSQLVKTILVVVETRTEASRLEATLIGPEQLADRLCLNLRTGGDNDFVFSEEIKRKVSEAKKGNTHGRKLKGILKSEEHKRRISAALKGHEISQETRQKISKSMKDRN